MRVISFTCDYSEGAHPLILKRLGETNAVQETGYGFDSYSLNARGLIRAAVGIPDAAVFLLTGGTQTNATVIDAMLKGYEGVIAAETGHIAVHESGAIEFGGHKVLTLPSHEGKIDPVELKEYLQRYFADDAHEHMVWPGMVYLSLPTEYGTVYTKEELSRIREISLEYGLKLFVDGARLGYALASDGCDITLPELAQLCDAFYIGGTKVGALCGEAVVFPKDAPEHFFSTVKQHGALLAKGRLLGIQFETLFTDGLYFSISRNAILRAMELKKLFADRGIPFYIDSPTNQQFPVLSKEQMDALDGKVLYEVWERLANGRCVTRFATSWATTPEDIEELAGILDSCLP